MLTGHPHRATVTAVAAGVAYLALSAVGVFVTARHVGAPVLMPAAGALVALLVLTDPRRWPAVLAFGVAGATVMRAAGHVALPVAFVLALAHAGGALVVAAVARRLDPGAGREHDARGVLALLAGLAGPAAIALGLGIALGRWSPALVAHVVAGWTLGALIVAPAFLALVRTEGPAPAGRLETGAALLAVTAVCGPVFLRTAATGGLVGTVGYTFMLFPPLLWLALRARTAPTSAGLLVVAVLGVSGTLAGRGSFARSQLSHDERIVALQLFLAVATVCVLLVGVVGRQRLADVRRIGESEALYRLMAGALPGLAVALFDTDLRCVVSHTDGLGAAGVRTGIDGRSVPDLYTPAQRARIEPAMRRALAGETVVFGWETADDDGRPHQLEVRAAPHRDARGATTGVLMVAVDVTARAATEARLRHLADRDPLTGLLNRRAFEAALEAHAGGGGVLVVVDVDAFKRVNDGHGHAAGDAVLVAVAETLGARLRREDPVARLGGDEFAVLLPDADAADGERIAAALVDAVRARTDADPSLPAATVSAGACALAGHGPQEALRLADEAMYAAKRAGRDGFALAGR